MRSLGFFLLAVSVLPSGCASRSGTGSSGDDTDESGDASGSEAGEAGGEADATDAGSTDAGDTGTTACEQNSECVVANSTCCGVCGTPTVADVVGEDARFRKTRCQDEEEKDSRIHSHTIQSNGNR